MLSEWQRKWQGPYVGGGYWGRKNQQATGLSQRVTLFGLGLGWFRGLGIWGLGF